MNNRSSEPLQGNGRNEPPASSRKGVVLSIVGGGVVIVVGVLLLYRPSVPPPEPVPDGSPTASESAATPTLKPVTPTPATPVPPTTASTPVAAPPTASTVPPAPKPEAVTALPAIPPGPEPSAYTRSLLANLSSLDLKSGAITPEQATFWKGELEKLTKEGAGAVPAIREFLRKDTDMSFAGVAGGDALGASSMRQAMFDTLRQIGGPDASLLSSQAMLATGNPQEIAALAHNLETMAPGQYNDAAVAAARIGLANAAAVPQSVDTGPLFEVLQKYGGAQATTDLQLAAKQWNTYAPIALASLPEGAGIPALISVAQNADGSYGTSSRFAYRMLAQLAPTYPEAANALIQQAKAGTIPESAWFGIGLSLGGETMYYGNQGVQPPATATEPKGYHIQGNQQNYNSYNGAAGWTPDQVQKQLDLIKQLSEASTTAAQRLESIKSGLAARLGQK